MALGGTANGTAVSTGATLAVQGSLTFAGEALTLNGAGFGGAGALESLYGLNTWSGNLTLSSASTVNVASDILTLSGPISGSVSLTKTGAGLLLITNSTNNYTGGTIIQGGAVSGGGLLGTGNVTINAGGTLQVMPGLSLNNTASAVVSTGGTLELFTDLLSTRVRLSGGLIASHGNRTVSGGTITDAGDASFSTYGKTLTLLAPSQTLALTGFRTWTVDAGSTVVMAGNFSGGQNFTKLGDGTLVVQGTSNIANLKVGDGSSAGGYMVGNAALAGSVTIAPRSLYTVQVANHPYSEVSFAASSGVLALSRPSNATLDFTFAAGLYLGVYDPAGGVVTYTGSAIPNSPNIGNGYLLGGGKGILNLNTVLADARDESNFQVATDIHIGWPAGTGQDPLPEAMVCLSAPTP